MILIVIFVDWDMNMSEAGPLRGAKNETEMA